MSLAAVAQLRCCSRSPRPSPHRWARTWRACSPGSARSSPPLLAGPERLLLRGMRIRRRADGTPRPGLEGLRASWFSPPRARPLRAAAVPGVLPGTTDSRPGSVGRDLQHHLSSFVTNTTAYYAGETTPSACRADDRPGGPEFPPAAVGPPSRSPSSAASRTGGLRRPRRRPSRRPRASGSTSCGPASTCCCRSRPPRSCSSARASCRPSVAR